MAVENKQIRVDNEPTFDTFVLAYEKLSSAIVILDRSGLIKYANHAFLEMFGFKAKEIEDIYISELVNHPFEGPIQTKFKTKPKAKPKQKQKIDNIQSLWGDEAEVRGRRKMGEEFDVRILLNEIMINQSEHFIGLVSDLSHVKYLRQTSSENEEKYRLLFETSEDPMWLIVDQKFEICNDAAVKTLGYKSEHELKRVHPSKLSPLNQPDGQSSFAKAEDMMQIALEKGYNRFEWIHQRKNGENFPVEVTLTRIPFERKMSIYCVWRDITELKNATRKAEDANKAKSDFLANMSHDLRTPLNAILGFSELMTQEIYGPFGNKKYQEYSQNIFNSGKYLLTLISDILDISKIEAGERELHKKYFDVRSCIDECYGLLKNLINEKQQSCKILVPKKLPLLFADRQAVMQILINLISNAIKFTPRKGAITIKANVQDEQLLMEVSDNGMGIPAPYVDFITEPFKQINTSPDLPHEGTGLGLAIVKALTEMHGGKINIKSIFHKGTRVTITLPLN